MFLLNVKTWTYKMCYCPFQQDRSYPFHVCESMRVTLTRTTTRHGSLSHQQMCSCNDIKTDCHLFIAKALLKRIALVFYDSSHVIFFFARSLETRNQPSHHQQSSCNDIKTESHLLIAKVLLKRIALVFYDYLHVHIFFKYPLPGIQS